MARYPHNWTQEDEAILGTVSDAKAGEIIGVPHHVAKKYRIKLGIRSWQRNARPSHHVYFSAEEAAEINAVRLEGETSTQCIKRLVAVGLATQKPSPAPRKAKRSAKRQSE